mmetsp:Transcript_54430/g.87007  ORF Transcript_54430/g.87007 Transcript_54430/m.87007 type:complete len:228 (+) Transcript_54430:230-913(+)
MPPTHKTPQVWHSRWLSANKASRDGNHCNQTLELGISFHISLLIALGQIVKFGPNSVRHLNASSDSPMRCQLYLQIAQFIRLQQFDRFISLRRIARFNPIQNLAIHTQMILIAVQLDGEHSFVQFNTYFVANLLYLLQLFFIDHHVFSLSRIRRSFASSPWKHGIRCNLNALLLRFLCEILPIFVDLIVCQRLERFEPFLKLPRGHCSPRLFARISHGNIGGVVRIA